MGKIITSWMLLATPFTVLALSLLAYATDHRVAMPAINYSTERWPELAGMIVGQVLIMLVLWLNKNKNPRITEG